MESRRKLSRGRAPDRKSEEQADQGGVTRAGDPAGFDLQLVPAARDGVAEVQNGGIRQGNIGSEGNGEAAAGVAHVPELTFQGGHQGTT
ncbi:MAG: hypothetical protein RLZZ124_80 [Cyanobacteriota bacterium]